MRPPTPDGRIADPAAAPVPRVALLRQPLMATASRRVGEGGHLRAAASPTARAEAGAGAVAAAVDAAEASVAFNLAEPIVEP
jgi:hypothetical protein